MAFPASGAITGVTLPLDEAHPRSLIFQETFFVYHKAE